MFLKLINQFKMFFERKPYFLSKHCFSCKLLPQNASTITKGKVFILMLAALCVSFLLICFFKRQLFSLWSLVSPPVFLCVGEFKLETTQHIMWYFGSLSNSFASYQRKIKMRTSWITWSIEKVIDSSKLFLLNLYMFKFSVWNRKDSQPSWIYVTVSDILNGFVCGTLFKREQVCYDYLFWNKMPGDSWKNPK